MARFCGTRSACAILVCCHCCALILILRTAAGDPAVVPVDSDNYYAYEVNSDNTDNTDNSDNATETLEYKREQMMMTWANDHQSYQMTPTEQNAWNPNVTSRDAPPPCIRQEYRTLSDVQRQKFHTAFARAKTEFIDQATGSTWLNLCTLSHLSASSPEAHNCPVFLPFHRCFLQHLEAYLRQIDPSVCLPYWCSTMDSFLFDPSWSLLWSPPYMGTSYGPVFNGFCAYWPVVPSVCTQTWPTLCREMSNDASMLLTDAKIAQYMSTPTFVATTTPTDTTWEQCHGDVHICIGGHMADLRCAPCDPIFYMHHCYIDYLWEQWRKKNPNYSYPAVKTKNQRATDYMLPWNDQTIISIFSQSMPSTYAPCPGNCTTHKDCNGNGTALWCNKNYYGTNLGRCMAGIAEGGPCNGFPNDACCFKCANSAPPICNRTTNTCQCVTPCASDANCLSTQWCCKAQGRCIVQLPLGSTCIAETEINRACIGDCTPTPDYPVDPGYNRMPVCYDSSCQCCDVQIQ